MSINPKNAGTTSPEALELVLKVRASLESRPDLSSKLLEPSGDGAVEASDAPGRHQVEKDTDDQDDIQRLEAICTSCDFLLARVQRELRELKLARVQP